MSNKELLMLFLIDKHPSLKNIYSLTKIFDRVDFPTDASNHLKSLMNLKFIEYKEERPTNEMPIYKSTTNGKAFLESNLKKEEILNYINTLHNPTFLYELTEVLLSK